MKILKTIILISLLSVSCNSFADLNTGLVAYWSFDDCNAKDNTNQLNGTLQGSPSCVAGKVGKAFSFNSDGNQGQYVILPTIGAVFQQGVSSCAWVQFTDNNRYWERIIDLGNGQSIDNIVFAREGETNNLALHILDGSGSYGYIGVLTNDGIRNSTWKHYCFTQDVASSTAKLYIDGQLINSSNAVNITNVTRTSNFIAHSNWSWDIDFKGLMDEVKLYNRALTAAEVTALYQQGTTPNITSISPTETVIGKPTTFEVRGQNLSADMGFTVGDCAYSNVALAGGTPELQKFVCTQFGTAGTKRGLLKTKPNGTLLHKFDVSAVLVPSTTPMTGVTGKVKIGSINASGIVLSDDNNVSACRTNAQGQFNCQVPQNWTGVLRPYAKNVSFSPAIIKVENGTVISSTTLQGTTTDTFPSNGVITNDWVKDAIGWQVDMSNGEIDDLRAYEGRFSFRSASIAANQYAAIQTTINMPQEGDVRFARRVSSNRGHGVLTFSIDGKTADTWSGEKGWDKFLYRVTAGAHTLRWIYKKDNEAAKGNDAAWIDDVSYNSSVQTGTTTCVGITQGTLKLMTIPNPTCEQAKTYATWLKEIRLERLQNADIFINSVKGVDVQNQQVQLSIQNGARLYAYFSPFFQGASLSEKIISVQSQFQSDLLGVACDGINDPVDKATCDNLNSAFFTLLDFGVKKAAAGALGTFSLYPYAAEKSLSTIFNLGFAWDVNNLTEEINSINIADNFLDEYYKGGMNLSAMRKKYSASSTDLSVLVDALANAKGYKNAGWFGGDDYLNQRVVEIINLAMAKNTTLLQSRP